MPEQYATAAARHFFDAEKLAQYKRYDGAGHLIGFAAECAIKHCVKSLGPQNEAPHLHFPDLIEVAKKHIHGRRKHSLFALLTHPSYMNGWKIADRYGADNRVTQQIYETWRSDAAKALGVAGIRRS